jgi:hypothetical protein
MVFILGSRVRVKGLQARPELNGIEGTVVGLPNDKSERYGVRFATLKELALKPQNLEPPQADPQSAADLLARLHVSDHDAEAESITISVRGTFFKTTEQILTKVRGSFFEGLLRQREHMSAPDGADAAIDRDAALFAHVLAFLRSYPCTESDQVFLCDPSLTGREELQALHEEADFFLLPPLTYLIEHRLAVLQLQPGLAPSDLAHREKEDVLRGLFCTDRAAPEIAPLHVGLVDVFGSGSAVLAARPPKYAYLLENLNPRCGSSAGGQSLIATTLESFRSRFDKAYPGLVQNLNDAVAESGVPTSGPSLCGWFVAGGAALRALQTRAVSDRLFRGSDVDIFIYARGPDASDNATKLTRAICAQLLGPAESEGDRRRRGNRFRKESCIHRTLFTINIKDEDRGSFPAQIILRVYHSPAEVLCGFDIDCCCVGFDGGSVWALPRALDALRFGHSVVNPLHAWPCVLRSRSSDLLSGLLALPPCLCHRSSC